MCVIIGSFGPSALRMTGLGRFGVIMLLHQIGITPEQLPPAEDVKKVERRLKSEEKKALEKPEKIKTLPPDAEKEDTV
jgi:DNA-damage-inducible protein D